MTGNVRALSVSSFGVIAFASGHCVHFYSIEKTQNEIKYLYSISPSQSAVTTLKFNSKNYNQILIGDASGRFLIFDLSTQKVILSSPQTKDSYPVCDLCWIGNTILSLRGNKTLSCFNIVVYANQLQLINIWTMQLPVLLTRLEIDNFSIEPSTLLIYGHDNQFIILENISKISEQMPENPMILESHSQIKDAAYHYHLPGYIFLVYESEIQLYHIKTKKVITVVQTSQSTSPFESIVQFRYTHRKILIRHFNGTISKYIVTDPYQLQVSQNAVPVQMKQRLFNCVLDPLDDKNCILFYHPFGLMLFDTEKFKIVSAAPILTNQNQCFDANKENFYCIGMKNGLVAFGNLAEPNKRLCFRVSDTKTVFFVSLAYPNINWATEDNVGQINIETRQSIVFKQSYPPIRCVGSHTGGLLVLRRPEILGVYVDYTEKSCAFNANISCFCFHNDECSSSHGEFLVVTELHMIYFIKYAGGEVQAPFLQFHVLDEMGTISSVTWEGDIIATGSTNGVITFINIKNPQPEFVQILQAPITYLSFCDNILYGMFNKDTLFIGKEGQSVQGSFQEIIPITADLFAYLTPSGYIRFGQTKTLELIPDFRNYKFNMDEYGSTEAPKENDEKESTIKVFSNHQFQTQLAQDISDIILEKENLRNYMRYCATEKSMLGNKIQTNMDENEKIDQWALVRSFSYSSQKQKIIDLLKTVSIEDPLYMFCTSLVTFLLGSEETVNEKQKEFLIHQADSLCQTGHVIDAVTILTLSGLDKEAVDCFLQFNQIEQALPMIRGRLNATDKKNALFSIAVRYMKEGKLLQSIPFFASSEEYHALLSTMFSNGMIYDCKKIKQICDEKGLLKPIDNEKMKELDAIISLDELEKLIDSESM